MRTTSPNILKIVRLCAQIERKTPKVRHFLSRLDVHIFTIIG